MPCTLKSIFLFALAILVTLLIASQPVQSLSGFDLDPKEIVLPFYTNCLTANNQTGINGLAPLMDKMLSKNFRSINAEETKNKQVMIASVQYFWKLIPNLKWEVREMLQDKNRVIVRSRAIGNPIGNFFGVPCNGSKSFDIMTIDIHTVENNQISTIYHEEEWTLAIKQLSGNYNTSLNKFTK